MLIKYVCMYVCKYHWTPKYLPSTCPCGKRFDVDHAMSCMKGGFVHRRYDEVQDLFASLLDVCHDVEVEPHLQTLTGEVLTSSANSSDKAPLDVSVRGFWQRGQRAFFDVRVFNPLAKSHLNNQKLDTAFSSNENKKKRHYNQRIIEVAHGSLSHHMAEMAEKPNDFSLNQPRSYPRRSRWTIALIHWLRAKLSFYLLTSAVLCVRGSRTNKHEWNTDFSGAEIANVIRR